MSLAQKFKERRAEKREEQNDELYKEYVWLGHKIGYLRESGWKSVAVVTAINGLDKHRDKVKKKLKKRALIA